MTKRIYNRWNNEDMNEALSRLSKGVIGFNEAHRQNEYRIPKPTLRRHFKELNKNVKFGRPKDLTENMEQKLVAHVLKLEASLAIEITSPLNKETVQNAINKKRKAITNDKPEIKIQKKKNSTITGDWFCSICSEDSKEDMIRCLKCKTWVHTHCAGVNKKIKEYFCESCA